MSEMKIFGKEGVLASDGEKVQCHICGRWFAALGGHVVAKHRITTDNYRSQYQLNRGTKLIGPAFAQQLRELLGPILKRYPQTEEGLAAARAMKMGRQEKRLEERLHFKASIASPSPARAEQTRRITSDPLIPAKALATK